MAGEFICIDYSHGLGVLIYTAGTLQMIFSGDYDGWLRGQMKGPKPSLLCSLPVCSNQTPSWHFQDCKRGLCTQWQSPMGAEGGKEGGAHASL